jgi:hypothetical protein
MTFKETEDVWRLYRREWVIVQTFTAQSTDGRVVFDLAKAWADENLNGRVRLSDIDVELNTDGTDMFWAHVKVYKDNLKGEFKHVENAQAFAKIEEFQEYTIVPRNSKSDHDIRSYGVVKL